MGRYTTTNYDCAGSKPYHGISDDTFTRYGRHAAVGVTAALDSLNM